MLELDKKFEKLVLKLQELNKPYFGYDDMPKKVQKKIDEIGENISNEKLIDKCKDKHFAKQLMIHNNVPEKYWK